MASTKEGEAWINPSHLVKVLVKEPFFRASLLTLMEDNQLQPAKVKSLVTTYPQLFRLEKEVVELFPKILLCGASGDTSCRGEKCRKLHICKNYLASKCDGENCLRCHDWDAEPNIQIIYAHFLENIPSNTLCKLIYRSYKELHEAKQSEDEAIEMGKEKIPTGKDTVWANSQSGEVKIPEICHDAVEGVCDLEENGCPLLHAFRHYHWQVRKGTELWYNLPEIQVKELEQSYCNPSNEQISLSRLEPGPQSPISLMGRDLWKADFDILSLSNASGDVLALRRLCTEIKENKKVLANTQLWYVNLDGKWLRFGTLSEDPIIGALTSETIENSYGCKNISVTRFRVRRNSCIINFRSMVYTNEKTSNFYQLRRRPHPHILEDTFNVPPLPKSWKEIPTGETFVRVALDPSNAEYLEIVDFLLQSGIRNSRVVKIERIQNPSLWRKFQSRILEMLSSDVITKRMFHSTKSDALHSICENGFDWKLQDSGFSDQYGQGNYFLKDARRAFKYCEPDEDNHRYMMVAKVAVGIITEGNPSMKKPPMNLETQITYDSTVNDIKEPTVFVKYNTDGCYPEYIVTLS